MYAFTGSRILIKLNITLLIRRYKFKLKFNNIISINNLINYNYLLNIFL